MKAVIFSGGPGTRMWPISRKSRPKQLEKVFGARSTLQQEFDIIQPLFDLDDMYVATLEEYENDIKNQLPEIDDSHLFLEPVARDVGPAVGNVMMRLFLTNPDEPVVVLFSDHVYERPEVFQEMLTTAGQLLKENDQRVVYFGAETRFPNVNLGWIELGPDIETRGEVELFEHHAWTYRPSLDDATKWHDEQTHVWNMGYWAATPRFFVEAFKMHAPAMYEGLKEIQAAVGTPQEDEVMQRVYPTLDKIHIDDAVITHIPADQAVVMKAETGWSDPGALDAMKEMLQEQKGGNVLKGKVVTQEVNDSMVYNDSDMLVATVGVEGLLVVVTDDAILVCDKDSVPEIKKLVRGFEGTEFEQYM